MQNLANCMAMSSFIVEMAAMDSAATRRISTGSTSGLADTLSERSYTSAVITIFMFKHGPLKRRPVFENAIYLQDQCFELSGLRFYGSPWLPDLYGWAFYLDEESRRKKWATIPDRTDVLITHTPPHGI